MSRIIRREDIHMKSIINGGEKCQNKNKNLGNYKLAYLRVYAFIKLTYIPQAKKHGYCCDVTVLKCLE